MSRSRYLIAYDISDNRRRTEVFKTLKGVGDHAQYSVFFCDLNRRELAEVTGELQGIIHHREDQVILLRLGPADTSLELSLECIGRAYCPQTQSLII